MSLLIPDASNEGLLASRDHYGQHLNVVPKDDVVLVRFGTHFGCPHWPELLSDLAACL